MAISLLSARQHDSLYNGRLTPFVVLSCIVASMGGLISGYDLGISGGVTSMESFLKEFFPYVYRRTTDKTTTNSYCLYDSHALTAFTSSLYIAGFFASILASWITREYGRKPSIVMSGMCFLAGGVVGGVALNPYMLIMGRALLGLGIGFANQAIPLYLSEMALPRHRGAINYGFQFSQGLGFILANLVNLFTQKIPGGWGWRISLFLAAFPACLILLGSIFLPETPNSLVQRQADLTYTIQLLEKIRGTPSIDSELNDIIAASATATRHPFRRLLKRHHWPHLTMAVALPLFQQVTGFSLVAFYSPVLFRTIGFGESASLLSSVIIGVIGTGCNLGTMAIVDRVGRRPLFIFGGLLMFVLLLFIGGIMASHFDASNGHMSSGFAYLVLVLICVYVASFQWSWGPLAWLVPSEIFPLEIRSAGQSVSVGVGFMGTFVVAQLFLTMLCWMKYGLFFFFGGWIVVMSLFVIFLLPETNGLPIEQMERVWVDHWLWRMTQPGSRS